MATSAAGTDGTPQKRKSGRGRKVLIGVVAVLVVAAVAGVALLVLRPWAPEIVVAEPGPGGERVTEDGMVANWYPATGGGRQPAVLVAGGSEGGIHPALDRQAVALHQEGYNVLAVSYFGAEGQPQAVDALPLEAFTDALAWLRQQPEVDPGRLAFIGSSKGAEAALLTASTDPELRAVVGYAPSNVAWAGWDAGAPWRFFSIGSSWSRGGEPVPYLPYQADDFRGGDLVALYSASLATLPEHPEAAIPVEDAQASLLLVCGQEDTMWPSCQMAEAVKERAEANGGPPVTVLSYPDAGHLVSGPPVQRGSDVDLTAFGGTQAGTEAALADGWPQVLQFLQTNLR